MARGEPRTRPDAICPQLYHKRINYTPASRAPAKRKENNITLATLKLFTVSVPYLLPRQGYEPTELIRALWKLLQDFGSL